MYQKLVIGEADAHTLVRLEQRTIAKKPLTLALA
jgi:hypothetical protein